MINMKLVKNIKNSGAKTLCAALIAASMMSMATPAFAANTSNTNPVSTEATSLKDDIKSALKEKDAEDKAEAAKKSAEAKKKANIDKASKAAAAVVVNMVNGKYDSYQDAIEDIGMSTLALLNDTVISEIPYIGKFVSALIGGMMGGKHEDPVANGLKEMSDQLKQINSTIEACAKMMMRQDIYLKMDEKITNMNEAYNKIQSIYKDHLYNYEMGMKTIADENDRTCRGDELKDAVDTLSTIYSSTNSKAFDKYKRFCNIIMCTGEFVSRDKEIDPNVFEAFNRIIEHSNNGKFADQEYTTQKQMLTDNVLKTSEYGYKMFDTIMNIELVNQEALLSSYKAALDELEAQRPGTTGEQRKEIDSAISSLTKKKHSCETNIGIVSKDLRDLNDMMKAVKDFVNAEKARDAARSEAFKAYKPGEKTVVNYRVYDVEKINGKDVFPSYNKDKKVIEYRDCYGNMVGTRAVEDAKKVSPNQVKTGETYHFEAYSETSQKLTNAILGCSNYIRKSGDFKVTEVDQLPIYITKSFLGIKYSVSTGVNRIWIYALDEARQEIVRGCIDTVGHWDVYQTTPTKPIQPIAK